MKTHQIERNKRAVIMREAGLTYEEIAKALSVTRQRAFAIVKNTLSTGVELSIDKEVTKV